MIVQLEEEQRQIVLLALAKLSIERPGWLDAIERVALRMDNRTAQGKPELLHEFRRIHAVIQEELQVTAEQEAKKELALMTVSALYASFDVSMLEEILDVGRKYEAVAGDREEVKFMNEALVAEIKRRKAR